MMDESPRQLARPEPEEAGSKTEFLVKFEEETTFLFVAVKLPGETIRVMQIEIEEALPTFIQDFEITWRELGDKVRDEFIRGATSGRAT